MDAVDKTTTVDVRPVYFSAGLLGIGGNIEERKICRRKKVRKMPIKKDIDVVLTYNAGFEQQIQQGHRISDGQLEKYKCQCMWYLR